MWQIVAFNRTGTRPALNQAVGYVRVAHIVLRGPLGPLSPTAASGWWFWKWQFRLPKWHLILNPSCVVKYIRVFYNSLRIATLVAVLAPGVAKLRSHQTKWMPVIRAPESIYKYQSQTCHKLAAFGTLDIEQDCSFTLIFQKWNIDLQLSIFRQSTNRQFYLPKLRSDSF